MITPLDQFALKVDFGEIVRMRRVCIGTHGQIPQAWRRRTRVQDCGSARKRDPCLIRPKPLRFIDNWREPGVPIGADRDPSQISHFCLVSKSSHSRQRGPAWVLIHTAVSRQRP